MAAPLDDMFSRCGDPGKTANCVEVRFIDNVKGKGLFAKRPFKKGETIFTERPLVSAQFLWNALYKYKACEYCLRALETAEENARRLSALPALSLPHPELCKVRPELHQACTHCQMMYCSSECRQAAWDQYHHILCLGPSHQDNDHPINKLQDAWRSDQISSQSNKYACVLGLYEICISYLDCCQRDRSRHSRHKILRENYLFVCSCQKCVAQMDDTDVTSEEEDEGEGETEGDEMEDEMTDV
ncbi:histone-lysine N-trimethyltransferase SMYD5 isoform X1 [Tachysurus ichikawai]